MAKKEGNEVRVAETITIKPLNMQTVRVMIEGNGAPLMQARFSEKAKNMMMEKMKLGSAAKKGKAKEARNFDEDFEQSMHKSTEGWIGIPASAFRNACIDVCRMVGYKMTHAKMSVFFEADGTDAIDGMPLIRLIAGKPERITLPVRNQTGVADIRIRPMWREWKMELRACFDADQFSASDVVNLIHRAGIQCGIGEGRPFSKQSNGMGFGTFTIVDRR